jgi:hypothetical protein
MALSRDQILATKGRLKTQTVHVPEWADGGDDEVIVRELTGSERDAFEASLSVQRPVFGPDKGAAQRMESIPDLENLRAKLVAKVIVDAQGVRVFQDTDIFALGELSASALQRVFDVAQELSGMNAEAETDAEGNSEAAPSGGSTSESPETSGTPT